KEQQEPGKSQPQPPFENQEEQDRPGSEAEMNPKADHGETSYVGNNRLKGLVALVTGGDSGIGRAVAIAFAREGADVAFSYLSEDADAAETVRLVEEAGRKACSYPIDQQSEDACRQLITEVVREFGQRDILVHNAAFLAPYEALDRIPTDECDRALLTNVYGT